MKLSLFSDYSLRVLMYAALKREAFLLDEVTSAYGISRHHLSKVVNRLSRLGYLGTTRGRGGGVRLAKPAGEIRIGALVRQTEAVTPLVECFDPKTNTCPLQGHCRLKGHLAQAMNAFYSSLDQQTLQDLVAGRPGEEISRILMGA